MIDESTLERIESDFPWASWAVWDESFPDGDCVEESPAELTAVMHARSDQLTPDVVLLGLNRSDDLDAPFQNFHAATRKHYDYRLKEFIQDGELDRLHGAYMTDLVDDVDPDQAGVTVTDTDAAVLLDQFRVLGQSTYHVVCFGEKPFRGLIDYFDIEWTAGSHELQHAVTEADGMTLHLYRAWFYGAWGANQDKVEILKQQLEYLDDEIEQFESPS